ncbi:MAG: sugar phosphate isomerase/epimerase [Acidobacteria bacterium]|nr:sugar phosphate isomerase/epimerase [Acidobacteriota bacterium]
MNRRNFLKTLTGGALFLKTLEVTGQTRGKHKLSKIGLQLYTVRKALAADFAGTLERVAATGVKEVEFAGYFDRKPDEIAKILKRLKLDSPSAHIDTKTLRGDLGPALEAARAIGHRRIVLGYVPEPERKTLDDYKKLVEAINKAAEACRTANLGFAYHNHDFEFRAIDGKVPYELILAETSAAVEMEIDLYWIGKAGFDPLPYFEQYPGRFPLVHVKDMDATPKKDFTEVGRGVIDFRKIFAERKRAGFEHYYIEQDTTPGDPLASIKISFDYLKALRF